MLGVHLGELTGFSLAEEISLDLLRAAVLLFTGRVWLVNSKDVDFCHVSV